jgi:hypothetical protein
VLLVVVVAAAGVAIFDAAASHYCECEDNCCYEVVVIVEMIHLRANREYHILMNSPGKQLRKNHFSH